MMSSMCSVPTEIRMRSCRKKIGVSLCTATIAGRSDRKVYLSYTAGDSFFVSQLLVCSKVGVDCL
jgi:hypothetical protein